MKAFTIRPATWVGIAVFCGLFWWAIIKVLLNVASSPIVTRVQ